MHILIIGNNIQKDIVFRYYVWGILLSAALLHRKEGMPLSVDENWQYFFLIHKYIHAHLPIPTTFCHYDTVELKFEVLTVIHTNLNAA